MTTRIRTLLYVAPLALAGLAACHFPPPETTPGEDCGGIAGLACDEGEFCNFPVSAQCGAADQTGTCDALPTGCTREYAPVCGCDDQTYGNACMAHASGVSVAYEGECTGGGGGGATCGGIAGLACATDEFCNYEPEAGGQGCDGTIADAAGVCQPVPDACDANYDPVCGCDGQSYSNACVAHAAGVSVASQGECGGSAVSCDLRTVTCDSLPPSCPDMQVPEIVNGCYGGCVPIDRCGCDEAQDCNDNGTYTCHMYRHRCGPYVN